MADLRMDDGLLLSCARYQLPMIIVSSSSSMARHLRRVVLPRVCRRISLPSVGVYFAPVLIAILSLVPIESLAAQSAPSMQRLAELASRQAKGQLLGTEEDSVHEQEVVTIDGRRVPASLVAVDEAWNLRLDTADRQLVLSPDEIVSWGSIKDVPSGPLVLLDDGSWLVADLVAVNRDSVHIGSRLWEPAIVPLDCLVGIILQPATGPLKRDQMMSELLAANSRRDRVILRNGDILEGLLLPNAGENESDNSPAESISIQIGTQALEVPRDQVTAIQWSRATRTRRGQAGGRAQIGFRDGSFFDCANIEEQRDRIKFSLACGVNLSMRVRARGPGHWDRVVAFLPRNERIEYLSDLEVAQYEHRSAWGKDWDYQIDANVLGGKLRSKRGIELKGIGMHSASSMAFYLDGKYRRLQGDVALDLSSGDQGSVIYRIYVTNDGREWTLAFESPVVKGRSAPLPFDVSVADALAVSLEVDYADLGDMLDRANWLQLRLTR